MVIQVISGEYPQLILNVIDYFTRKKENKGSLLNINGVQGRVAAVYLHILVPKVFRGFVLNEKSVCLYKCQGKNGKKQKKKKTLMMV